MIPLSSYANRLSARPGDTIEFKVSSMSADPYEARLVRIICADPNPEGPGILEEEVAASFAGRYPSRIQETRLGSYVRIEHRGALAWPDSFTLLATIWPTTPGKGTQGVIGCYDEEAKAGFALCLDAEGAAAAIVGAGGERSLSASSGVPLRSRHWYRIWASFDASDGTLRVGQLALDHGARASERSRHGPGPAAPGIGNPILIAALGGRQAHSHFNGKVEAPMLFERALDLGEIAEAKPEAGARGLLACWDFSRGTSSLEIEDLGPHELDGTVVNLPARGMTGSTWQAQEMCWRHAPEHYGAIHFHDDDFYDCGWETDFAFQVPEDFRSGVYALRLRCGEQEDNIPFFVCPPRGSRQSDLCVVIPTFTYLVYSNNARHDYGEALERRMTAWNAYPWNPAKHPEYGLSAYNLHSDDSGICHVSSLRPLMTLKSGYLTLAAPGCGSGLRHFQADTHLLAWLAHQRIDYDIVTDQELHDDGAAALAPYRAVLTATHPEYHTAESLDAFRGYRDSGGRLAYLGGNGFYWRVALHRQAPGAIEIRRGEGGIRTWAAEPGENYNAFDGCYGGLWRRSGRPPQALAGVGFSSQGTFLGSYYRRTPESRDPRVSWIFDSIEEEVLGDFGLSGGGAAGYELDRLDCRLGSPDDAIVVARSENHADTYVVVPEEILTHVSTITGEDPGDLIRADMIYFETSSGGAVFSVGSITFCGSLPCNGFDNNISRLLSNVVRRFLVP